MSASLNDPPIFGGLVNANIKANTNTFLNLGQRFAPVPTAPSSAPTVPAVLGTPTQTSITVSFDVFGITGDEPIDYSVFWGTTASPTNSFPATLLSGTIWTSTITGLNPDTSYYFKSRAVNIVGEKDSVVSASIQTDSPSPGAPSGPPTIPTVSGTPSQTSITVRFDVAGISGVPPPDFSVFWGETPSPTNPGIATFVSGTTYVSTVSGLTAGTAYYFISSASNASGTQDSAVSARISTAGTPITPPSGPPTVPVVSGIPTQSSITITFSVAGITGSPVPEYSILWGTTTSPTTPGVATFLTGSIYQAIVSGLTESTDYYFKSVAGNSVGNQNSTVSDAISTSSAPPPPPPSALQNLALLTFLSIDGAGIWSINTSGNPDFGSMMLTGVNAGTWQGTDGKSYLNGIRVKPNTELILSLGGSAMDSFLSVAFPSNQGAIDLCNTIWNVLFGAASPNTLNWSNLAWAGSPNPLFFKGIDLDMEGAIGTGILGAFMTQWTSNVAAYGSVVGSKTLTMAPQSPNTWLLSSPSTSIFTNNFTAVPFASSASVLSSLTPGFLSSSALIAPTLLQNFSYVFIQVYNQPALQLGSAYFNSQMAQWAYLVMTSNRINSTSTKIIWGFGTTDIITPVWDYATDAPLLAAAIPQITALVNNQLIADGRASCINTEWSGGWGAWNSPSNISSASTVYLNGSLLTPDLMGSSTILYANASGLATTWNTGLPIVDYRS
jgi:hypothetical protein